tara:strand:+ start:1387 stop:2115 length:729 start_codon:yes stop_codon:yes gene_type:complete
LFKIFKSAGIESYRKMQKKEYSNYTKTFSDAKNLCVGSFEVHEAYPYEEFLLQHFEGKRGVALDFACGVGRMMKRMLDHFDVVDGVDISEENLGYTESYLSDADISQDRYSTFLSGGVGVNGLNKTYDFIYSTIALQHICVYEVRRKIFEDLFVALKASGSCCFQLGFGWDNKTHWFDNNYVSRTTNGVGDVSIPNLDYLDAIRGDFEKIGFKDVKYEFKVSPHPEYGDKYHPIWLFIHMNK